MAKIKISELPSLNPATLDTTYVVGISGSTTYKISINQLTSSLDTTFASDLVVNAVSGTINTLATTASFNTLSTSVDSRLDGLESFSSSADNRYVLSGSITQTTWDNIANKPFGIVSQSTDLSSLNTISASYLSFTQSYYSASSSFDSRIDGLENATSSYLTSLNGAISSSTQISDLGFVTGSYTTITLFNSLTQSFNSISQSFSVISGSVGTIDFSTLATTASNTFIGNQTISGSTYISGGLDIKNNGYSWSFDSNGKTRIPNITFNSDRGTGMVGIKPVAGREFQIETSTAESSAGPWVFGLDGTLSAPNGANILRVGNLVTTASFNSFTQSYYSASSSFDSRIDGLENATSSYLTSLNGAISSSAQVLNGSGIYSSSAQLPIGLLSSSLGFVATSSYSTDSASFNSRIISGSAVAGTISGSSQIAALGYATTSSVTTISASAWGAFQSASSYSSSLQTSITTLSSSVDSRLDSVEATIISGSPNYTQVLGNRRTGITSVGTSIISGSITTTGNPVQIMVTGDANPVGGTAFGRLQIYRDGNAIGAIVQVENSTNLNVPYCLNVIDTPSVGTYVYSMRLVDTMSGTFDFGEVTGPLLTAVELKTNTNLPSTNNTFTGTNRFNGQVTLGGASGDEGGELQLAIAQTNTTLTGSIVSVDIYQDRLRIFEAGGTTRGVYVDLSKAPAGNAGELMWKASGMVNAGTFVTLDNLKCAVTTVAQGNRGLSIGAVSTTFEADVSGWYTVSGGSSGITGNNQTYTTTASNSLFNWNFPTHGDMVQVNLRDKTNNRFYRITMMIGASYISNFISIERLF
jgi:hypothetical protein